MPISTVQSLLWLLAAIVLLVVLWRVLRWSFLAVLAWGTRLASRFPDWSAWQRTHPWRARVAARFPRTAAWLQRRLDPHVFVGLPLTLLIIATVYVATLIGGQIEGLLEAEEMLALDRAVNTGLQPWRSPLLVRLFAGITEFGDGATLTAVAVTCSALLWAHGRVPLLLPLWVSFLGAEATSWAGKFAFARERPEFLTAISASYASFPSGHATGAMAVYGFLAYLVARDVGTARRRFDITYWAGVLILLVGFSRVFLSVHYTSDVVTGFLVGGFWLLVGFTLAEHRRARGG